MARNKYPEETVNRILDVSVQLFLTKGYENTSIQDIIDHLGGLSKGAIYHHFKSKESILLSVYDRLSKELEEEARNIRTDKSLTGLQKLQKLFMSSLNSIKHREALSYLPNLLDNPQFLAIHLKSSIYDVVPNYIEPVIEEGIKDGSIQTDYPKELAQLLVLISNVWMNPLIYPMSDDEISSRIEFFQHLSTSLGLSVMDDNLLEHLRELYSLTKEKRSK